MITEGAVFMNKVEVIESTLENIDVGVNIVDRLTMDRHIII